jgi:hypothetical protein
MIVHFVERDFKRFLNNLLPYHNDHFEIDNAITKRMSLRYRKEKDSEDIESGGDNPDEFSDDQGTLLSKLTQLQQRNRELERNLSTAQNQLLAKSYQKDENRKDDKPSSLSESSDLYDRGTWLIGLLILQSCSSFILAKYETLLAEHQALIYFLTMLVGAGGNAGNQSCVKMVRELAIGLCLWFV